MKKHESLCEELPEKADDPGTLIKVPYKEPDDELNVEPEPEG